MRLLLALLFFGLLDGKNIIGDYIHNYFRKCSDEDAGASVVQTLPRRLNESASAIKEKAQEGAQAAYNLAKDAYGDIEGGMLQPMRRIFAQPYRYMFPDNADASADDGKVSWLKEALNAASVSTTRTLPHCYYLFVDVPGIPLGQIHVRLDGRARRLYIQGEHEACGSETDTPVLSSAPSPAPKVCVTRSIDREFRLPDDVDVERVGSEWRDGMLTVMLPRLQHDARDIPVKSPPSSWFG